MGGALRSTPFLCQLPHNRGAWRSTLPGSIFPPHSETRSWCSADADGGGAEAKIGCAGGPIDRGGNGGGAGHRIYGRLPSGGDRPLAGSGRVAENSLRSNLTTNGGARH